MTRPPTAVGQVFNLPERWQVENLPHVTARLQRNDSTTCVSTSMETSHEL